VRLIACCRAALAEPRLAPGARVPEGWDGRAAERVVDALRRGAASESTDSSLTPSHARRLA
jgi:hypothetical protein